MKTARDTPWARFWDARGRTYPHDDPIAIDGWDYGISRMGPAQADFLIHLVTRALDLDPTTKLLEVGCGAGMLLGSLSAAVDLAYGCDLAESMLQRARRINPNLEIQVAEAVRLPYASARFDAVLVYSVFHYFPSDDYARNALRELYRICRPDGRIWIGDVPDQAQQQAALAHRARLMKENDPVWPWPEVGRLDQRFYDQQFFVEFAEGADCELNFMRQQIDGYLQGQYRYNVHILKR
jgi:SAM-dependent methyltransferase